MRTGIVLGDAFLELNPLSVSQRYGTTVRGNAVPNFLNQGQPLLDGQPINTEGFD